MIRGRQLFVRELFPGWYPVLPDDESAWADALIVPDASVLLNLYKYRVEARAEFLMILDAVRDRLWIPYHVALEFQRNRLTVIADQYKKFSDVRDAVEEAAEELRKKLAGLNLKKQHSTIDTSKLENDWRQGLEAFLEELAKLEREHQRVNQADPIRDKLDALLEGRIGPRPKSQEEIDSIEKDGACRYDREVPPGFRDAGRDGKDMLSNDASLRYQHRFGDYMLWRQLLDHVGAKQQSVIFVTDDAKDDWWHIATERGDKKRLGPNVHLVHEFAEQTEGKTLILVSHDQFLTFARERLNLDVSEDTITQVRDIAEVSVQEGFISPYSVERTAFYWLKRTYPDLWIDQDNLFPDFVVDGEKKLGYEFKYLRNPQPFHVYPILETSDRQARRAIEDGLCDSMTLALVATSIDSAELVRRGWEEAVQRIQPSFDLRIFIIARTSDDHHPHLIDHASLSI